MSIVYSKYSNVRFNGQPQQFLKYSSVLIGDALLHLDTFTPFERCILIKLILKFTDEESQIELNSEENDLFEKIVGKIE